MCLVTPSYYAKVACYVNTLLLVITGAPLEKMQMRACWAVSL